MTLRFDNSFPVALRRSGLEPMGEAKFDPFTADLPALDDGEGPSLGGALFRQENLVGSAIEALAPVHPPEEGHDPLPLIKDTHYEDYLDNFVGSRSEADTRWIMGKIDREQADRKRIADAPLAQALPLGLAIGLLDPTMLLPFGAPVKVAKGGSFLLRAAAKGAVQLGGAVALQEAGLQATQQVRTATEGAFNIASGTLLGAILGPAVGALSRGQVKKLEDTLDGVRADLAADNLPLNPDQLRAVGDGASAGAAAVGRTGTGELEGALGVEKALGGISPITRLQRSEFGEARETVRHIDDAGLKLADNKQGVVTSEGGTIANRIKLWNGGLGKAVGAMDDAYSRYWFGQTPKIAGRVRARIGSEVARATGRLGQRLTAKQFRQEIGRAMARGDQHAIPEVAEAAAAMRKEVFDPLKDAAIRARLLPADIETTGALSYVTRMYNRQKIIGQRNRFHDILFKHFRAGSADMIDAEVDDLVDGVIDNILGASPFRMPGLEIVSGPRGPLKERVLDIPDEQIEDFLERDIEDIARYYVHTMAPDVEIAQKFGDVQMSEPLRKLADEKNRLTAAATTDKERTRIAKRYDVARGDIEALRDRMRHSYRLPEDPDGMLYRLAKIAQQANLLRLMGGMTLSAIPDLARPIMVHGLTNTFRDGFVPLIRNIGSGNIKLARDEIKEAGTALDMLLDTRARSIADLFDDWQRGTKLERGINTLTNRFGLVSLMAPWNAAAKQFTGIMVVNGVLKSVKAVAEGRATAKQISNLASSGIDETMAARIWQQFSDNGGQVVRGLTLPNTEDWTDRAAKEALRVAVVRDVDRTIVTPGLELPLFMSHPLGKIMGQFKSFAFSSAQRTLLAGLQQRDAAFLNGAILSLGLGAFTSYLKMQAAGRDTSNWSPAKWATEGLDQSGLLTVLSDVNNIAEKVSWGRVGLSAFTGEQMSRYATRDPVGSLMGPSFGLASEMLQVIGAVSNASVTRSDMSKVRRLLPFQNLFYLRRLFNAVEEGVSDLAGVPKSRSVVKN